MHGSIKIREKTTGFPAVFSRILLHFIFKNFYRQVYLFPLQIFILLILSQNVSAFLECKFFLKVCFQVLDFDSFLLHGITVTYGHGSVFF